MPGSFEAATVANLPLAYYRLNEMGNVQTLATNRGTGGAIHDGVYQAAAISGAAGAVGTDPAVSGPSSPSGLGKNSGGAILLSSPAAL